MILALDGNGPAGTSDPEEANGLVVHCRRRYYVIRIISPWSPE